jgi:hypothetical protein
MDRWFLAEDRFEVGRGDCGCCSASGPENAFCTETCWSSTKPISSAIGSLAISSLASSDSVK